MTLLQSFTRIPRSFRHLNRYREILFILIKYGLNNFFGRTKYLGYWFTPSKRKESFDGKYKKKSLYERIRLALEELGPTFVKFGQLLSNRPDILPLALIEELEKLQKDVAPFSFDEVEKIINEEYNGNSADFFAKIEPNPLASGSIAQVHVATLVSGEKVVLKIQRPGIARLIETDVEIMQYMARVVQKKFPELESIDAQAILKEFKSSIRREIDFNQEMANIERFQNNFKKSKDIYIPKLYKDLSSRKILVMEFIEGHSINDLFSDKHPNLDPKKIAEKGASFVLTQIFTHGFFHADPHPGNILILDDARICFIDYGMTGTLPYQYRLFLSDFIFGFIVQDTSLIIRVLKKFIKEDSLTDINELELRVSELVDEFTYLPLNKIDAAEVLSKVMGLLVHFKLDLPPVVYMLLKTMVTIEGVARKLDPDFNITEYVKPFAKKLLRSKIDPREFIKKNYSKITDLATYALDFPAVAYEITQKINEGKIKLNIEHKGLAPFIENAQRNNSRLALAIIVAAIFISSSMLVMAKIPPFWHGFSLLGVIGYALGALLTLRVMWKRKK